MNFALESRMTTTDGFYAAESYFHPNSVAVAILCQRLSLYAGLGLETSDLIDALPDQNLPAEVKPAFLPEKAFDFQIDA